MPNWVTHKLTLTATPSMLGTLLERHLISLTDQLAEAEMQATIPVLAFYPDGTVKDEVRTPSGPVLDFETLLPLGDGDASEVWGTKWNASMGRIAGDPASGSVTLWFDTPWSIPEPIFTAIAERYPDLKVEGHAFDELWNFAARITITDGAADVEEIEATVELYREVYGKEPDKVPDRVPADIDEGDDDSAGPITEIVKAWLDENDWTYDLDITDDESSSRIKASVQIASQDFVVCIDVDEDDEQVEVLFFTPFNVPVDRIEEMAVVLNWINNADRVGRMIVPVTAQPMPIQWKAIIDVEGSELSPTQVGTIISAAAVLFEAYTETISSVALTKRTADDAIKDWEGDHTAEPEAGRDRN